MLRTADSDTHDTEGLHFVDGGEGDGGPFRTIVANQIRHQCDFYARNSREAGADHLSQPLYFQSSLLETRRREKGFHIADILAG